MTKFKCYDIEWDTETEDGILAPENLPTGVIVELSDDEMAATEDNPDGRAELVCDKLSEKIGWLVRAYQFEQL